MGLFDGFGEYDNKRKADVQRRQAALLDEQIAEKQQRRAAKEAAKDRNAVARQEKELYAAVQQQVQVQQEQSVPFPQSQVGQQLRQVPLLPIASQPIWGQVPAFKQPQPQILQQQPFFQQLQNQLLQQPVMQLPSLLAMPIGQQLPPLPAMPAKHQFNPWEAPRIDLSNPSPPPQLAWQPAVQAAPQKAKRRPEVDIENEWEDWKLRREAPKPLAFGSASENEAAAPSKLKKRPSRLIDIDAEWKIWEDKRKQDHPQGPPIGFRESVSPNSKKPFVESSLEKAAAAAAASGVAAGQDVSVTSPAPKINSTSPAQEASPIQSPPPPLASVWAQPPRKGLEDMRALVEKNLVDDLQKVKRNWFDERDQLHWQAEALKKQASRLRAEQASMPSPSPLARLQGVPYASRLQSAPERAMQRRIEAAGQRLVTSDVDYLEPAPYTRPRAPEAFWLLSPTSLESMAPSPGGLVRNLPLDTGEGGASHFLADPVAEFSGTLPEASSFLAEPDEMAWKGGGAGSPKKGVAAPPKVAKPSSPGSPAISPGSPKRGQSPAALEVTLSSPAKGGVTGTEVSDLLGSLQYSDSESGQTLYGDAQASLGKVIDLGAELRKSSPGDGEDKHGEQKGKAGRTQDFLRSALIPEEGGGGSSAAGRPPLAPGKPSKAPSPIAEVAEPCISCGGTGCGICKSKADGNGGSSSSTHMPEKEQDSSANLQKARVRPAKADQLPLRLQ